MMVLICLLCFHSIYWNAFLLHLFPIMNTFYTFFFSLHFPPLLFPVSQFSQRECDLSAIVFNVKLGHLHLWSRFKWKSILSHSCPLAVSLREIPFCLSISPWLTDCWADARLQTAPSVESSEQKSASSFLVADWYSGDTVAFSWLCKIIAMENCFQVDFWKEQVNGKGNHVVQFYEF